MVPTPEAAKSADTAATSIRLRLLVDREAQKVIFAEAEKDFVDFLFNFLFLPVGGVIRLISQETMVGSLGKLYQSIENLKKTYMEPNQSKELLLNPRVPATSASNLLLLPGSDVSPPAKKFYECGNYYSHHCVSEVRGTTCLECRGAMDSELRYVVPSDGAKVASSAGGYVKDLVTYMVMDDLSVMPLSMISTIAVLNDSNVSEFEGLEEKEVDFGLEEGLKLLEASLKTKAALSWVFLNRQFTNGTNDSECVAENPWLNGEMLERVKE